MDFYMNQLFRILVAFFGKTAQNALISVKVLDQTLNKTTNETLSNKLVSFWHDESECLEHISPQI